MTDIMKQYLNHLLLGAYIISTLLLVSLGNPLDSPATLTSILLGQAVLYLVLIKYNISTKQTLITAGTISIIYMFMPAYFNDFWRFLWDGKLSLAGINPYNLTPWEVFDTPTLAHLTNVPYWDLLYFKWSNTIYPPTLQYIFLLANLISADSALMLKVILLGFTWGSIGLAIKLLEAFHLPRTNIAWLALHPLFLFESLAGTHLEPIIIFFIFLTILLWKQGKLVWASIAFGATILTKFFPLLLGPLFLIGKSTSSRVVPSRSDERIERSGRLNAADFSRRYAIASLSRNDVVRILQYSLFTILTLILLYLPFTLTTDLSHLTESLSTFSGEWVMSPGIFAVIAATVGSLRTKMLLSIITIIIALYQYWQYKKHGDIMQAAHNIFFWLLALSSVVFSWYTLWLVAFLPFIRRRWPTILLSTLIATQYLLIRFDVADNTHKYLENGEILWHQLLVWVPTLAMVCWHQYRKKKYE